MLDTIVLKTPTSELSKAAQKAWTQPTFEVKSETGAIAIWSWVDTPTGKYTYLLNCALGKRYVKLDQLIPPDKTKSQNKRIFKLPAYEPISLNAPTVLLEPERDDYQSHLHKISEAKLLVVDLETFGQGTHDGLHPWRGLIRLIQLFDGELVYIADLGRRPLNDLPLFQNVESDRDRAHITQQPFFQVLRERLASPECRIIGHNLHFDLRMLATQLGLKAQNVACTLLGAMVFFGDYGKGDAKSTNDPIFKGGYSLKNLVLRLFNIELDKIYQKSDWGGILTIEQINYAAKDVIATYHLYQALRSLYQDQTTALYNSKLLKSWEVENACLPVAVEIECWGMPVYIPEVAHQKSAIEQIRQQLIVQWKSICPTNITYNQTAALLKLLGCEYNIHLDKLDKTNLAQHQDNPLVSLRLKLKALDSKLNNLKGFARSAERDGRVHTTYRTLTGFGRFSSGESKHFDDLPNLQAITAKENPAIAEYNLPNPRSTIKPPEGYVMAVVDLAGAHGRIAADQAKDETAIAGNNDDSVDNHSKVAVYVAKCQGLTWDWEDIAKLHKEKTADGRKAKGFRNTAKNTYYSWLNGAGPNRVKDQIAANTGIEPLLEDCQAAIEGCKALYPKVLQHRKRLHQRLKRDAVEIDERLIAINNTSDGFRVLLPLVPNLHNPELLEAPYTQSLASLWTRIEATAIKKALPKILQLSIQNPKWDLQIIGVVHDEVDVIVKEVFAELAIPQINNLIGDEFQKQLNFVTDGRETDWKKLLVNSWADK